MPDRLIDGAALNKIENACDGLPFLTTGSYEVWLDGNTNRVDFNLFVDEEKGNEQELSGLLESGESKSNAIKDLQASAMGIFEEWADPGYNIRDFIQGMWLVYDNVDSADRFLPWFYFQFRQSFLDDDPLLKSEVVMRAFQLLDSGFGNKFESELTSVLNSFPLPDRISNVGAQISRGIEAMRLYMEVPDIDEVNRILQEHGWTGDLDYLNEVARTCVNEYDWLGFFIDFDPKLKPKIAIEIHFAYDNIAQKLPGLLQKIVGEGFCSNGKAEAILEWLGEDVIPAAKLPAGFKESNEPEGAIRLKRSATVKLNFENDTCFAKAYPFYFLPASIS